MFVDEYNSVDIEFLSNTINRLPNKNEYDKLSYSYSKDGFANFVLIADSNSVKFPGRIIFRKKDDTNTYFIFSPLIKDGAIYVYNLEYLISNLALVSMPDFAYSYSKELNADIVENKFNDLVNTQNYNMFIETNKFGLAKVSTFNVTTIDTNKEPLEIIRDVDYKTLRLTYSNDNLSYYTYSFTPIIEPSEVDENNSGLDNDNDNLYNTYDVAVNNAVIALDTISVGSFSRIKLKIKNSIDIISTENVRSDIYEYNKKPTYDFHINIITKGYYGKDKQKC